MKNLIHMISLAVIAAALLSSCNKNDISEISEQIEVTEASAERVTCVDLFDVTSRNENISSTAALSPAEYIAMAAAEINEDRVLMLKFELPENLKVASLVIGFETAEKSYIIENQRAEKGNIYTENICFIDVMDGSSNILNYYLTDHLNNRTQIFTIEF